MTDSPLLTLLQAPSGAWAYLEGLGRTSGLSLSWSYPGGPTSAEVSLDAPATAQYAALTQGATVTVLRGTSIVWAGRVATIDRGTPWRIECDGLAGLATREPVATTGSLDSIVDQAITNGLPWTRPASLSSRSWSGGVGSEDVGQATLDKVLTDTLLTDGGKRWTVTAGGVVTAVTDPTTVSLVFRSDTVPPVTLNDYATEVIARYQSSSSAYSTRRVTNAAAQARFGRVPKHLDLSGLGTLTSTTAQAYAQAYLDRVSPRLTVAGDFTVTPGQVITATGGPVDLPMVRPGVLARVQIISQVRDALLVPQASVDLIIGATKYDADRAELTISPVQRALTPVQIMFGARSGVSVS